MTDWIGFLWSMVQPLLVVGLCYAVLHLKGRVEALEDAVEADE